MKQFEKTSSGSFINYSSSSSALPVYFRPLPSCASKNDEMWVLETPDIQEIDNSLGTNSRESQK